MKLIFLLLLLFVGLFNNQAFAQQVDTSKLNDYIDYIEQKNQDIGNISIFTNGNEVYNRSFGQKYIPNLHFNENTRYHIGSITKLFTATLIWQLIEQGKLKLDAKLAEFFPDMPNAKKITIKNLLEHSSGLGDYFIKQDSLWKWLDVPVTENKILKEIKRQGVLFEPGDSVRYSNSGYYLLTKILEDEYNKPFGEILYKQILQPFKLSNTYSIQSNPTNVFASYLCLHTVGEWEKHIRFRNYRNLIGVGSMVSTPKDLNKFIIQFFNWNILKRETIDEMKPVVGKEFFGRGLMLIPFTYSHLGYGHNGDIDGNHSAVVYFPNSNLAISFAINGENYPHNKFLIDILKIIFHVDFTYPEFEFRRIAPEILKKYLGTYSSSEPKKSLTISEKDSVLSAQGLGFSFLLKPNGLNKFTYDKIDMKLEFLPQKGLLIINERGKEWKMKKEK